MYSDFIKFLMTDVVDSDKNLLGFMLTYIIFSFLSSFGVYLFVKKVISDPTSSIVISLILGFVLYGVLVLLTNINEITKNKQ